MLANDIDTILQKTFGFSEFRTGQSEVINLLLAGKSALAVFPTGSGKSLCYQLPALFFQGLTLVVSPLIALMKDQIDFLVDKGIPAARLDSTLSLEETTQIYQQLRNKELKLLMVAPERLSNERFINFIKGIPIDLLVIDEAHCISEWGHNFRPDYLKLARVAKALTIPRVLTLTATATPKVSKDICQAFNIAANHYINTGFYRPNLTLKFTPCDNSQPEKLNLLAQRLISHPQGPTIVYVTLQKTAEDVASFLEQEGQNARAYHAGLKNEVRAEVQDWFMDSNNAIVVATIAFGMGIDKSNIRYVYHFNLPKSLENYSQEIGRAGRDGLPSVCEVLASGEDMIILENFVYGDTPDIEAINRFIDFILSQENEFNISVYELSNRFDIRPLVVNTFLTYLELLDVIESIAPYYDNYQFKADLPLSDIAAQFDPQRAEFLSRFFNQVKTAKIWCHADLDAIAVTINEPRDRIVKALNYLEEKKLITLKVTGVKHKYRKTNHVDFPDELKKKLIDKFYNSEQREISRLEMIVNLINYSGCKVSFLLNYFGENFNRACGHCSFCLKNSITEFKRKSPNIKNQTELIKAVESLKVPFKIKPTTRQMTRFLCGIMSPVISKRRLKSHPLFGKYAKLPFGELFSIIENISQQKTI
jgi:ATP-dependent DNA helicase RecQ